MLPAARRRTGGWPSHPRLRSAGGLPDHRSDEERDLLALGAHAGPPRNLGADAQGASVLQRRGLQARMGRVRAPQPARGATGRGGRQGNSGLHVGRPGGGHWQERPRAGDPRAHRPPVSRHQADRDPPRPGRASSLAFRDGAERGPGEPRSRCRVRRASPTGGAGRGAPGPARAAWVRRLRRVRANPPGLPRRIRRLAGADCVHGPARGGSEVRAVLGVAVRRGRGSRACRPPHPLHGELGVDPATPAHRVLRRAPAGGSSRSQGSPGASGFDRGSAPPALLGPRPAVGRLGARQRRPGHGGPASAR